MADNPVAKLIRARIKRAAGADTTATGEPDYAKMFNRFVRSRLKLGNVSADSTDVKPKVKGIAVGGDD